MTKVGSIYLRPGTILLLVPSILVWIAQIRAEYTTARFWNEHLLHAISIDTARPTVHARNLFSLSTAMYDYMGQLGQSSDPSCQSYHTDGLPRELGLVEVVTSTTTATGGRHANLADQEAKIAVRAWRGAVPGTAPFDGPSEIGGVGWIPAEDRMPYQLLGFVTPPFAGYVSGHSTLSRTSAEILTQLTGTPFFPGGIFEYEIPAASGLDFEYGPMELVTLQFATYFDASDQASLSRLNGGIHPSADDFAGRRKGHLIGSGAWTLALQYFNRQTAPEPGTWLVVCIAVCLAAFT